MSKSQPRSHQKHHLDRQIEEVGHDPYHPRDKLREPTVCSDCGAVYADGRWRWTQRPAGAHEAVCPACQRVRDRFPAGTVTLSGDYFAAHRDEVLNLARTQAEREKAEHPMQRIMDIREESGGTVIDTTDLRMARLIGDAIHNAWHGSLEVQYSPNEYRIRVHWSR